MVLISPPLVQKRQLGATGVQIPEIGFGTWRYAGGVDPLVTAIDTGAAFIDTAETYGSEETVGKAIKGRRSEAFLASKVRPANFRKNEVIKACEGSLRRLGTDYLDLYQLHWPNYTVPIAETMAAMKQLAEQGKIRFIGVSNFSIGELKAAQRTLSNHRIVSNQVRYSLIERTIEDGLLEYCQKQGITIIAFSPFGTKFSSLREHDPEAVLAKLQEKYQKTVAQVALNWILREAGVVVIPKASSAEHVREDCGGSGWSLSKPDCAMLSEKIFYRSRGPLEKMIRRCCKRVVQRFGKEL